MDLDAIRTALQSSDSGDRLKALTDLRNYDAETAIPLLLERCDDREFLVRSFVAMGLGRKQSPAAFTALLEMAEHDADANVRAEASNSLSLYGAEAVPHLVHLFARDRHWLLRRSILAALAELNCPEEMAVVCELGLRGEDGTVRESAVDCLGLLAKTPQREEALQRLLRLSQAESWRMRRRVALALTRFDDSQAKATLQKLTQDEDHRVVGAALEGLV